MTPHHRWIPPPLPPSLPPLNYKTTERNAEPLSPWEVTPVLLWRLHSILHLVINSNGGHWTRWVRWTSGKRAERATHLAASIRTPQTAAIKRAHHIHLELSNDMKTSVCMTMAMRRGRGSQGGGREGEWAWKMQFDSHSKQSNGADMNNSPTTLHFLFLLFNKSN